MSARYGAKEPGIDCALREQGAHTAKAYTAKNTVWPGIRQRAKRVIVMLGLRGFLPAPFTSWLLQRLGLVSE